MWGIWPLTKARNQDMPPKRAFALKKTPKRRGELKKRKKVRKSKLSSNLSKQSGHFLSWKRIATKIRKVEWVYWGLNSLPLYISC